jgi:hypothetical protein
MASPINDRVRKHREAMRLAGLRLAQLWVPDTRQPSFAALCREQSASLLNDPQETEMLDLIEVTSDHKGWR